jgi:flagellar hook-basal body complex protein FliE
MQTNALSSAVSALTGSNDLVPALGAGPGEAPFSSLLKDAVANVQSLEDQASSTVQGLMNGSGVDVHQAMIATEKSEMAFEMTLAVRNKAVAAYQQLMQMQF